MLMVTQKLYGDRLKIISKQGQLNWRLMIQFYRAQLMWHRPLITILLNQLIKLLKICLRTNNASETALVLRPVTKLDVEKVVMSLKSSRAKDIYGIDTLLLKQISSSIVNPVTHIINSSLDQGRFPTSWKPMVVAPIFKGGNPRLTSNYRPNIFLILSQ